MSKPWTPKRPTVELRASRIRREPPPRPSDKQTFVRDFSEHETWHVVVGVLAFAIAFTYLIFWISDYTANTTPEPVTIVQSS